MTAPTLAPPREVLPWDAPREAWLAQRLPAVTATDIAALVGVHPYRTAYEVYAEKVGDPFPDDAGEAAEIGLALEPVVADMWQARPEGQPLARVGLLAHGEHDWMRCSPDRLAIAEGWTPGDWQHVTGLVEVKTALGWTHLDWTDDEVPDPALMQTMWQMAVSGVERVWLVTLAGPSLKTYTVERDQDLIDSLMAIADQFLTRNVAMRIPPAADGSQRLADKLSKRWTPDPEKIVVLNPADFWPLHAAREVAIADLKDAKQRKTEAENTLRLFMGDAEAAVLDDRQVATWRSGTRAGYVVEPTNTRTLRIKSGL